MNWPRNRWISRLVLLAATLDACGCGVKGDPLPPVPPVEMGRGRPTYRRATKQMNIEKDDGDDAQRN